MPEIPDRSWFDPVLDAYLHTGSEATAAVVNLEGAVPRGSVTIAMDIETPGLNSFDINCVTAAWEHAGQRHSVLLRADDRAEIATLCDRASELVFHHAAFDVPILFHHKLIGRDDISKATDTLITARLALPDQFESKTLEACVRRWLGMAEFGGGMDLAFKAAGHKTRQAGYEHMTVDSPIYRLGAMADTVMTLRLLPEVTAAAVVWLTDHPFKTYGATTAAQAAELIAVPQRVNRVMLARGAVGLPVDLDYLDRYEEQVAAARACDADLLAAAGLRGGSGQGPRLIAHLEAIGQLPPDWPLTATGKLKATKNLLDELHHPLALAQRRMADTDQVLGYLEKVRAQAAVTGRCHPCVNVLGASSTGRMSMSSPELHQFSADARPIIVADDGRELTSIDWAQIEPVTMALMAGDDDFLAPFEAGADLYEPVQRSAGITRPMAKVVVLALMYGQGTGSLARAIGHTLESAAQVRRQVLNSMPGCAAWMSRVQATGAQHGRVITAAGRILPVARDHAYKCVNHVVQGSAADILYAAVCEADARGVADSIYVTMHDEIICSTEAAGEMRDIMSTPPDFLQTWAGRTPVIRTDRADLGRAWKKA